MILSIHIPKTAGKTFESVLQAHFGPRLMLDYSDWPESKTLAAELHHQRQREEVSRRAQAIASAYDIIHGHFLPGKYSTILPSARVVTFVRDPYQHAISAYAHARRAASSPHPGYQLIHENDLSIVDFIEAFPNHQSVYFSDRALEDFDLVGVTERFDLSVELFGRIFRTQLPSQTPWRNVNPARHGVPYDVPEFLRNAVDKHRAEDIALYRRATERFDCIVRAHT